MTDLSRSDRAKELDQRLKEAETLYRDEIRCRIEAEETFRQALRNMPVMVFASDEDGGIVFFNPEFEKITGYTRDDLIRDPGIFDLIQPRDINDRSGGSFNQLPQSGGEWVIRAKDGSEKIIAWSNLSSHCPIPGWKSWGIGVDITENKRMERLRMDMERITRHDLKAPLTAILGFSELLMEDDNLTDLQRHQIKRITSSGERMLHMIENSLMLYQIEAGTFEYQPEQVDLFELFDRLESELIRWKRGSGLRVLYLINGLPVTDHHVYPIMGVASLLENLFVNLIKNAMEASPPEGTVTVNITTDSMHRIDIHNEGVIPAGVENRFFERFATAGKAHGTGLGTYSALLIARSHGGDITFTSSQAEGTHVIVALPTE